MRRAARHRQRGQILPLWSAAIIGTFALTFMVINYGNTVRWQIRAQNAADAAAQALMAIQTQRFNELTAGLYAANVEEFRTRALLDGLLNSLDGSGGCTGYPTMAASNQAKFATGTNTCDQVYGQLVTPYIRSVNRYTVDVARVNDVSTKSTFANWSADAASLLKHLTTSTLCNTPTSTTVHADGGDCAFQYTLNGIATRSSGLNAVSADAYDVFVPTQGFVLANNTQTEQAAYFDPGMIDIVVCAKVPPVIPFFSFLNAKTHYVVGRAGATAVLAEEDWLQPGALKDPARSPQTYFQPQEQYATADASQTYDWYGVTYGGNAWAISGFIGSNNQQDYGYVSTPTINDLSAYVGWWNAIPYDPRNVDSTAFSLTKDCPP